MATFQRKPIVKFNALTDTGLDKLSVGSIVTYTDGLSKKQLIEIKDLTGMTGTSTLTDFLGTPANYEFIADESTGPTAFTQLSDTPASFGAVGETLVVNASGDALEFGVPSGGGAFGEVTENTQTGIRKNTADPLNYGDIGNKAIDLSESGGTSTTRGATGDYAVAMGRNTTASGYNSVSGGYNTTSSGGYSTSLGYNTNASGNNSFSIGRSTKSSGYGAVSMGLGANYLRSEITTYTDASGKSSFAMGHGCVSSGENSVAMGSYTSAVGYASIAMGNTEAPSDIETTTDDGYGTYTTVYTTVPIKGAMATNSVAIGNNVHAINDSAISLGKYNVGTRTDTILEVGIGFFVAKGDDTGRQNALEITTNGQVIAPSVSNALIDAESTGKILVTKEYVLPKGGTTALRPIDPPLYTTYWDTDINTANGGLITCTSNINGANVWKDSAGISV